ncbi:MAG: ABC transporter ATP-binding protein [Gammaproteobacteria bacterium]|nr:ABC transporter ATP-binding protein [Gammaproteobacteria bacterium]
MRADPIIQVNNLKKKYPRVYAVQGIHFELHRGHCLGLLGPNGAGKTTTIEMLEGITPPSSGEILYKGKPLGKTFHNQAGIQFQATALQEFLTAKEHLTLFQNLYPQSLPLSEVVELCSLHEFLNQDASQLSGGQRQRLLLAIAMINDPEVLFLDEPTTGLDPQARRNFWSMIDGIKQRGKTVLLTTHYMEEAYQLCDQILIMDHGKIIASGSPDELLKSHFQESIITLPSEDFKVQNDFPLQHQNLGDNIEIRSSNINQTLQTLLEHKIPLQHLQIRKHTLEDLFLALTGKELRQ